MSLIADRIKTNLSARLEDVMVVAGQETATGGALLSMIHLFEQEFLAHQNHDCIAIDLDPSVVALASFIASLSVAKNTACLDTNWPSTDRESALNNIGADIVVERKTSESTALYDPQSYVSPRMVQTTLYAESRRQMGSNFTCFTSGTTGTPKGCMRSEESWIASFHADQAFAKITPQCKVVVLGSFAHSLGVYAAVRALYGGAKVFLFPRFEANKIAKQIFSASNAILFGVPTQYISLAKATNRPLKSVIRLLSTGAKLPKSQILQLHRAFPKAEIIEFYGTSELSYVSARKIRSDDAPTSVGAPLTGVDVAINHDNNVENTDTKIGLIFVRSLLAFDGYIIDSKFVPAENWISVGDTGYVGEGGNLHLVGRVDRMFQSSGRNIVPEAIETALMAIDGIKSAAVFGQPDPTRENRIVCAIEITEALTRKSVVSELKSRIVAYTIPYKFYLCDNWPKTTTGKTDFRTLKPRVLAATLDELS